MNVTEQSDSILKGNPIEFQLKHSQINEINRRLCKPYKLELYENILKQESKPEVKRQKSNNLGITENNFQPRQRKPNKEQISIEENSSVSNKVSSSANNKRSLREKKPNTIKDYGYVEKNLNKEIEKRCDKVFQKLKKHKFAEFFYQNLNEEISTLDDIENNLKSGKYTTTALFGKDVRKLWTNYFSKANTNPDLYQKTFTISNYFEEIFKEVESVVEDKSDIHELTKKVSKLQEKYNEINKTIIPSQGKRDKIITSASEKPMTFQEKTQLGNNIRKLTPEQLKGIISILSDSIPLDQASKYFEFDIETISTKKLRELEKFVKLCLKGKSNGNTVNNNAKKPVKKPLDENDKFTKLKNDLKGNNKSPTNKVVSVSGSESQIFHEDKKEVMKSNSDESESSSNGSDSESLSEIDFKKKK